MKPQRVAGGIELVNYFLLVPATFWMMILWRSTFQHHYVDLYPDMFVMQIIPTGFFGLGLSLHILYFQYAHHKTMRVTPATLWLFSTVYNLIFALYLLKFGTFVTIVFIWPACIAILSFACFLATSRQSETLGRSS